MHMKPLPALIGVFALAAIAGLILIVVPAPKEEPQNNTPATTTPAGIPNLIEVSSPLPNGTIGTTGATITGRARGFWYFEASFPVEIKNTSGTTIAQGPAQAQGEWMTEEFVSFGISLSYPAQPSGSAGTIILHKDNPSGEPSNDQSVSIPIVFM